MHVGDDILYKTVCNFYTKRHIVLFLSTVVHIINWALLLKGSWERKFFLLDFKHDLMVVVLVQVVMLSKMTTNEPEKILNLKIIQKLREFFYLSQDIKNICN